MKSLLNEKLRAWWWHRQALDGHLMGADPASVLQQTGWARSVGGVGPYLALFARAGTSRETADQAAANLSIHELPSARGCTYVLPASDFALGLQAGQSFAGAEMKVAYKLGVTDREVDKLCEAVVAALARGPLDPDELRAATGKASRSLGEEGKKKGLTTTLPLALGRLQSEGEIRRVPMNGRFDQQRYRYTLWKPNPVAGCRMSPEEIQTELARRFFTWTAPGTLAEFQTFSALGVKTAKTAIEPLKLVPVDGERLMLPEQREQFEAFQVPKQPQYALLGSIDSFHLVRGGLDDIVDASDRQHKLLAGVRGSLLALPSHGIYDRGRLIGLWEYDTESQAIAWALFIPRNRDLAQAVERTEAFVRDHLGDARAFSLDSPKSRMPRIQALRKLSR